MLFIELPYIIWVWGHLDLWKVPNMAPPILFRKFPRIISSICFWSFFAPYWLEIIFWNFWISSGALEVLRFGGPGLLSNKTLPIMSAWKKSCTFLLISEPKMTLVEWLYRRWECSWLKMKLYQRTLASQKISLCLVDEGLFCRSW